MTLPQTVNTACSQLSEELHRSSTETETHQGCHINRRLNNTTLNNTTLAMQDIHTRRDVFEAGGVRMLINLSWEPRAMLFTLDAGDGPQLGVFVEDVVIMDAGAAGSGGRAAGVRVFHGRAGDGLTVSLDLQPPGTVIGRVTATHAKCSRRATGAQA